MLTSDLVRPRVRRHRKAITIDWLKVDDAHWQQTAEDLIRLFMAQVGQPYHVWQAAVEQFEGERMDYVTLRGLAKVLEDAATFTSLDTEAPPSEVRERLFAHGPTFSTPDLFHRQTRDDAMLAVADELNISTAVVEQTIYADRGSEYLLRDVGTKWTPDTLLARYNLELARGVLYDASEMRVELHDHYKDFWRYMKLFKLMFEATRLPKGGYQVRLDGPISPFVSATRRYGRQFAAFLPALFLGKRWKMRADIRINGIEEPATYALDNTSPLKSHFKRSGLFDSRLEADFAKEFAEKFGGRRGQWQLTREDEVVLIGDAAFIPDFALTHKKDGRRALIELVGFWHPDYLKRKVAKVRAANLRNLVLLVRESVNLTADKLANVPGEVVYFPNKPVLKDVMAAVEACAQ
jgi:predicted nuclease of restriction endonuclease-like RecB superfamily